MTVPILLSLIATTLMSLEMEPPSAMGLPPEYLSIAFLFVELVVWPIVLISTCLTNRSCG